MIMSLFELKFMVNITEPEVDALFTHFINEFKEPVDDLATDFWDCLKEEKKILTATSNDIDTNKKTFIKSYSESMAEKSFFVNTTYYVRQDDETLRRALVSKEATTELSNELDKLIKMRITDKEFDEFVKLYFIICSAYPEYLSEVWPNVIKIKKAIIPPSFLKQDVTCKSHNVIS